MRTNWMMNLEAKKIGNNRSPQQTRSFTPDREWLSTCGPKIDSSPQQNRDFNPGQDCICSPRWGREL